jgi:hemerythrin HHE cation binding domain-containing protein
VARKTVASTRSGTPSRRSTVPASTSRSGGSSRRPTTARSRDLKATVLQEAGLAVGKVLRGSTEVVKEVGAGLVSVARGAIAGAVTGERDAVSVLKMQHRQVESLFKRVLSSEDPRARKQLLQEIAEALAMHTKIEEEIFYPAVRSLGTETVERLIDEAFEEHHVVDLVLAELPRVSPQDDRFIAKMTVLSELVDHHVQEEEGDMFKRAQRLGKDRLQELGARLDAAAARNPGAGAPRKSNDHRK